jgi:hypothetical protein
VPVDGDEVSGVFGVFGPDLPVDADEWVVAFCFAGEPAGYECMVIGVRRSQGAEEDGLG